MEPKVMKVDGVVPSQMGDVQLQHVRISRGVCFFGGQVGTTFGSVSFNPIETNI